MPDQITLKLRCGAFATISRHLVDVAGFALFGYILPSKGSNFTPLTPEPNLWTREGYWLEPRLVGDEEQPEEHPLDLLGVPPSFAQ